MPCFLTSCETYWRLTPRRRAASDWDRTWPASMRPRRRSAASEWRCVGGFSSFFLSRMTSLQKKPPTFRSCCRCRLQSLVLELL